MTQFVAGLGNWMRDFFLGLHSSVEHLYLGPASPQDNYQQLYVPLQRQGHPEEVLLLRHLSVDNANLEKHRRREEGL